MRLSRQLCLHTTVGPQSGQSVGGQMEDLSFCLSSTIHAAVGCAGFLSSLRLGFSIRDVEIVIVTLGVTSRMK